jgi:hypothetical protein
LGSENEDTEAILALKDAFSIELHERMSSKECRNY